MSGFMHEWHVAINTHADERRKAGEDWPHFMYEAKSASQEVKRLKLLFRHERTGRLPSVHQQCSRTDPEALPGKNHLSCCLGVRCDECPHLAALDAADISDDERDEAKAWTCVGHILMSGGDRAGEGYLLTVDDRMFWNRVYESLGAEEE